ncbi:MAG: ferrochelatase [Woeseiaceae bacterium]
MSFESLPQVEHRQPETVGVLLVNLGTPDAPTPRAVRRYLRQFLSDPRVVELPRWFWWLVLQLFVLRVRPARSAALYRKIWTERGSPLWLYSNEVATAIRERLSARTAGPVTVELAMSYGNPSIPSALQKMDAQQVTRIAVLPLYPQYSGSTTGSVFDSVTRVLSRRRHIPAIRFINHYYDAPGYIAAIAASVREFRQRFGRGERLLFSFHGLPRRMVNDGDPYLEQCRITSRRVAEALDLADRDWQIGFQSRIGRQEWLRPYTDETLQQWGKEGMEKVDVVCPGFAVDCLETLEEIAMRYAQLFAGAGGGELRYIPALNARDDHTDFLSRFIEKNIADWTVESSDCRNRPAIPGRDNINKSNTNILGSAQ